MPDLPTITVTAEQQTRILEAYKDMFGTTTNAETVAAYKKMIAQMVRSQVLSYEQSKINTNVAAQHAAAAAEVNVFMTGV